MTEIFLQKGVDVKGHGKYDLYVKDMPADFLGLAVDLKFTNSGQAWKFLEMSWGEMLKPLPQAKLPLQIVRPVPEENKIVMGLTFKATEIPVLKDGVLVSFIFDGDLPLLAKLENKVISVYQQGKRVDLPRISWKIAQGPVMEANGGETGANAAAVVSQGQLLASEEVKALEVQPGELAADVLTAQQWQAVLVDLAPKPLLAQNNAFSWLWGGFIGLVILAVLAGIWWKWGWSWWLQKRGKKSDQAGAAMARRADLA